MQLIGNRISILKKDNLLSIVILPTTDKKKLGVLFFWLFAWTVSGIIVLTNYFKLQNADTKLFIIIWLGFWAYFEFKIASAFLWKRFGKEKLWIKNHTLHYQREVSGRGKIKTFSLNLVSDFKFLELNKTRFSDFITQSFWVKGGERLEFTCQSVATRFAMQLNDQDAKKLLHEITSFVKQVEAV